MIDFAAEFGEMMETLQLSEEKINGSKLGSVES